MKKKKQNDFSYKFIGNGQFNEIIYFEPGKSSSIVDCHENNLIRLNRYNKRSRKKSQIYVLIARLTPSIRCNGLVVYDRYVAVSSFAMRDYAKYNNACKK